MPSPSRNPVSRELKNRRIELRVTASAKGPIKRAMAISGLTAGDRACAGARRVIDDLRRTVLTGVDRDAFLDVVANPPKPTDRLITALRRHKHRLARICESDQRIDSTADWLPSYSPNKPVPVRPHSR